MKANLQTAPWQALGQKLRRWSGRPPVEIALRCVWAFGLGFILSGVKIAGSWMPLGISLLVALGLGLPSFSAYAGCCMGYIAFFGVDTALEPLAVGLLVEAGLCIFGNESLPQNRWFLPGCTMLFTGLVGFLFLLQGQFAPRLVWRFFLRLALAGGATALWVKALGPEGKSHRLLLWVSLCGGLCALRPFGMPLGLVAGCALAAAAADTPMALSVAVLSGLALDLCWGGSCTAVLTLAALGCRGISRSYVRLGLWLALALLGVLLAGANALVAVTALLGAMISVVLPRDSLFGRSPQSVQATDPRLRLVSGLLEQLGQCMSVARADKPDPETNAVFDQAAERVCRLCSRWDSCWGEHIQETCEALNRAAPAMMTRGKALREDLSPAFAERCRHMEGFLNAVNRELDDLGCRRQYRNRLRESRAVLAQQYHTLSQALAQPLTTEPERFRFRPELGFRSQGRTAGSLSGDRGASFRVGKWFYLLLCDGMGSGSAANAEAATAISILRVLLQSGVDPDRAMALLNGIYILRDDGGFATVDLLQTNLDTGDAQLFKWGGAPSYLKRRGQVEKIGTASPPPGLGVGEEHRPVGEKLSLSRGEMLVLVSDGAGGEAAERFIRQYGGLSPKELASGIVHCSQSQEEDDRTAAVLALRPHLSM